MIYTRPNVLDWALFVIGPVLLGSVLVALGVRSLRVSRLRGPSQAPA